MNKSEIRSGLANLCRSFAQQVDYWALGNFDAMKPKEDQLEVKESLDQSDEQPVIEPARNE